ncbi:hypothetical protein VP01_1771g5 [Puccinia sorghi]|uniref:Uncharacterized protein n=1 Tax=Puccinia sorghi TaxID=27349 RepID=A0A0L6VET5_9BASI|nr:hypothetical protein VP01_1771g5 [Puccinia sorghi]
MSANYAIYTSPNHQPVPDHLPTLIITPQGKPHQILYTYLHTNYNQENYLLTPSDQGDLCVAKLFPPNRRAHKNQNNTLSNADRSAIRCEASRNLKWTIRNEGIQNPVYKLTLPNPENPQVEQPLFQVSKPNPNCPWWTLFYFTYAGHLIPPKRIEFGKIIKAQANGPKSSGETKITVTGKTEEEKAVWRTLGEGNEDMVEWILVCAAMNVLDEEITKAAEAAGVQLSARPSTVRPAGGPSQPAPRKVLPPAQQQGHHAPPASNAPQDRQLHPTGNAHRPPVAAPIRPAVYSNNQPPPNKAHQPSHHHHPPQQQGPPGSQSSQRSHLPSSHNPAQFPPPPIHHHQQYPPSRGPTHAPPPGSHHAGLRGPPSGHNGKPDLLHEPSELAYRSARQPPPSLQMPPRSNLAPSPHHHRPPQNMFQPPGPLTAHPSHHPLSSSSTQSRAPIQVNYYPHSKHVR